MDAMDLPEVLFAVVGAHADLTSALALVGFNDIAIQLMRAIPGVRVADLSSLRRQ